jgi:hypothetical protein
VAAPAATLRGNRGDIILQLTNTAAENNAALGLHAEALERPLDRLRGDLLHVVAAATNNGGRESGTTSGRGSRGNIGHFILPFREIL